MKSVGNKISQEEGGNSQKGEKGNQREEITMEVESKQKRGDIQRKELQNIVEVRKWFSRREGSRKGEGERQIDFDKEEFEDCKASDKKRRGALEDEEEADGIRDSKEGNTLDKVEN